MLVSEHTKSEICKLRGGRKHDFRYFVGISETAESDIFTDILDLRLLNQIGFAKIGSFRRL